MSEEQPRKTLSKPGGFLAGGLAACGAVTVTNPIELIKTRMQLQGELHAKGEVKRVYTGPIQGLRTIFKHEGLRGVQRGLFPAYIYQLGLNGCRLGFYEPVREGLNMLFGYDMSEQQYHLNIVAGASSGVMGAITGSPFYLIKTRMQSYSPVFKIGAQTHYKSIYDGLSTIFKAEGFKGLYRGVDAAILRTGAGSSVQLPIYNWAKGMIEKYDIAENGPYRHLMASAVSGIGVCIVMNPWDVLMTRMYNQKGNLYKGPFDCLVKTVSIEGPLALYKGFVPHLFRIGPHTILTLMFMEQTMKWMKKLEGVPL
ncbi:mitochondrial oxaloacetate transport protein [Trichomonascus vanleenenianus]|uniref:Oac1p n=1 Tax=Trichomonascus vanleenenianus TaxID=2268995 RepID=UPI003ECBAC4C